MAESDAPSILKILIIDDDEKLCRLIKEYLDAMGYDVLYVHNGQDGLSMLDEKEFHAVILDVMMPGINGFDTLQAIRKKSDIPVLMLTARGDETDRIVGLEMGADDYLPKTFSTRELLARLRAVTRRYFTAPAKSEPSNEVEKSKSESKDIITAGDLEIHDASRAVYLKGAPMNLTPIEYDLLKTLAGAAGRVLSRDHLLDALTGRSYEVFDRSVDVHISSLRRKLGDDPKNPTYIRTVRAFGYMFKES